MTRLIVECCTIDGYDIFEELKLERLNPVSRELLPLKLFL